MNHHPRRILLAFHLPEALRDVLEGISRYVRNHACDWQVECVEPRDFSTAFRRRVVDGAITALGPRSRRMVQRLRASSTPVVNVLRDVTPHLPSVLSDNEALGREGAVHLLQRGFRQFAFVGVDTPWSRDRQAGFTAALRKAGFGPPIVSMLRLVDFDYATRVRAVTLLRRWVAKLPRGTGIMAAADFIGRSVLTASREQSLRVPDDVALLGVDNFHAVCELAAVPLTSVAQDFSRMGHDAAALLNVMMAGREVDPARPVLVPPGRLHVRKSTDVLAFEDPIVVAAMRLIQAHAATAISMKELLKQVPLSRKWLDHRFKKLIGRTPSEEIRRVRLEVVRELLTETDMPLRQIAARCRFSCVQNLVRGFRCAYGNSPQAYRMQTHRRHVAAAKTVTSSATRGTARRRARSPAR